MTNLIGINQIFPWWIIFLAGLAWALISYLLTPWNISGLISHPNPAGSYQEAVERITALRKSEPTGMNPLCCLQFMTHGEKVERAIVLVHGYTNCPQQFHELGQRFFNLGWNVLIAPMPRHGLADRMNEDHSNLKAEELAAYTDETVDIAQGLGTRITIMGLSAGGVICAWAAQFRADLDQAVIISPVFGINAVPPSLTAALMNLFAIFPDQFGWWDPVAKDKRIPPVYAYPRYSRHALAQTLRLGFAATNSAKNSKPAARKLVLVLNHNDHSVNNTLTRDVAKLWQAKQTDLTSFTFEASLKLGHDLIDPTQPNQQIEIVYPRFIELAT